jgi:hypothetical protein
MRTLLCAQSPHLLLANRPRLLKSSPLPFGRSLRMSPLCIPALSSFQAAGSPLQTTLPSPTLPTFLRASLRPLPSSRRRGPTPLRVRPPLLLRTRAQRHPQPQLLLLLAYQLRLKLLFPPPRPWRPLSRRRQHSLSPHRVLVRCYRWSFCRPLPISLQALSHPLSRTVLPRPTVLPLPAPTTRHSPLRPLLSPLRFRRLCRQLPFPLSNPRQLLSFPRPCHPSLKSLPCQASPQFRPLPPSHR